MYYMTSDTHGHIKLDWDTAWMTIRSIVAGGHCDGHRSFKLNL